MTTETSSSEANTCVEEESTPLTPTNNKNAGKKRRPFLTREASPHSVIHNNEAELSHIWIRSTRDVDCLLHVWTPLLTPQIRGVVVIFHGLGSHGLFPTVRYLAELLVEHDYMVYSIDFCGHGQSYGLRGYISSPNVLLQDAQCVLDYCAARHEGKPLFVAGGSMGGAVALLLSIQNPDTVRGLVLLAPMVSLGVGRMEQWLLRRLASWRPKMGLLKQQANASQYQFRDEERRIEAESDPFIYRGRLRVASAMTCIELTKQVEKSLDQITAPILCLLATEDVVVDNNGIDELMEKAKSHDKTLKEYDALHGLLCETEPLRSQIEEDIVMWIRERTPPLWR